MALDGLYRKLYEKQHGLVEDLFINPGEEPPGQTPSSVEDLDRIISRTGRRL